MKKTLPHILTRHTVWMMASLCTAAACGQEVPGNYLVPYRQGKKVGLSNEYGKMVVPAMYAAISAYYPSWFVAVDKQGVVKAVYDLKGKPVKDNVAIPGVDNIFQSRAEFDEEGTIMIRDISYKQPPFMPDRRQYRLVRKEGTLAAGEDVFRLEDLSGNTLLPDVSDVDDVDGSVVIIMNIDQQRRRTVYTGVYNVLEKRYVIKNPNHSISHSDGFLEIKDNEKRIHYFYNLEGELQATISDSLMAMSKRWNLVKKITLGKPDSARKQGDIYGKQYYAIRERLKTPFFFCDQSFHPISKEYTGLQETGNPARWLSYEINGKWGLFDHELHTVLQPEYDTFVHVTFNRYAVTTKQGARAYRNLQTGHIIHGNYDYLSPLAVNGKWLAIKYTKTRDRSIGYHPKAGVLYLVDSMSVVQDSMVRNDPYSYKYSLTAGGQVLAYLEDARISSASLIDIKAKTSKQLPYFLHEVEESGGLALVLNCRDSMGRSALLSADDFSTIVPFGRYKYFHIDEHQVPSATAGVPPLSGLLIKGGTETSESATIGFYDTRRRKYWKD